MCECTKHQEVKYPQDCRECDWEQEAEEEKRFFYIFANTYLTCGESCDSCEWNTDTEEAMNNKGCLECLGTGYITSGSGQKAPCPFCHDWNKKKTVSDLVEAIKDVCGQQYTIVRKEELNALVKAAREVLEKSWDFIESHKIRANLVGLEQAYRPFWRTDGD